MYNFVLLTVLMRMCYWSCFQYCKCVIKVCLEMGN